MDIRHIIEQLDHLNTISSALDVPEHERSQMIHQVTDFTQSFIAGLPDVKGYRTKQTGDLSIHDTPQSLKNILEIYRHEVAETGINAAAGTHLGYIPGGASSPQHLQTSSLTSPILMQEFTLHLRERRP